MNLSIGIVGLPNVGKSTLFSALTRRQVPAENYPFCTIEPNVGCIAVPDKRLQKLAEIEHSQKIIFATVDFVDIDPYTYNMNVAELGEKLERAELSGCLPKIVIPVHFAGQSCEMNKIKTLADRYGFKIVEDASHAIGGKYLGEFIGNCRYSDITVFSFHPVKLITTGEGGMALTNDAGLAQRMARLRSHGITHDPEQMTHGPDGPWYYQQIALGFNYRMTDLQAALGSSQMQRLDAFVAPVQGASPSQFRIRV